MHALVRGSPGCIQGSHPCNFATLSIPRNLVSKRFSLLATSLNSIRLKDPGRPASDWVRHGGCVTQGASRRVRHAGCVTQGASYWVRHIGCVRHWVCRGGCITLGAPCWVHHTGCVTQGVSRWVHHSQCVILGTCLVHRAECASHNTKFCFCAERHKQHTTHAGWNRLGTRDAGAVLGTQRMTHPACVTQTLPGPLKLSEDTCPLTRRL